VSLRRGFKTRANQIAQEIREEMGLSATDPLNQWQLAEHLAISLVPLTSLASEAASAVGHFRGGPNSAFSAITVFRGTARLIVYNDRHSSGRQASDLAHELAHALLLHPPKPSLGLGGRDWDAELEAEAAWLSGALLIPDEAALSIARSGMSTNSAAEYYGVSEKMVSYRLGVTAAYARIERTERFSRRRWG